MNKYLIPFILFLQCTFVYAESAIGLIKMGDLKRSLGGHSSLGLKTIAHAQANYVRCKSLAKKFDDQVMVYYYDQMLQSSKAENEANSQIYNVLQLQTIENEYEKALLILNKVNSASLHQLCLNRFDPVSRQHFQAKLEKL